jgi:hypothetical protein
MKIGNVRKTVFVRHGTVGSANRAIDSSLTQRASLGGQFLQLATLGLYRA